MYYDLEYEILCAFLCGLPRKGREKGMKILHVQSSCKWEYPLSFYFINMFCPGFTVLAREWTCHKQCNCEFVFRERRLLAQSCMEEVMC